MGMAEDVNLYDVNSLYPYIQREARFPDPGSLDLRLQPTLPHGLDKYEGVAMVHVKVPFADITPLPARVGGGLFFPHGEWRAAYCLNELRYALELGVEVLSVEWAILSKRTFNPFADFVDALWAKRQELRQADDLSQWFVKMLMNGSIGRYGVRTDTPLTTLERIGGPFQHPQDDGLLWRRWLNFDFLERPLPSRGLPMYANVIFAAYVAAGARVFLHKAMMSDPSNVVYCDTDSIITRGTFETGPGLGDWKLQMEGGAADLIGPKEYALYNQFHDATYHAKGIPARLAQDYINQGWARFERALSIREAQARGESPATWVQTLKERGDPTPKRPPASSHSESLGLGLTVPWEIRDLQQWYQGARSHLLGAADALAP